MSKKFQEYERLNVPSEMRDVEPNEDMTGISISDADIKNGSPKEGDKVARNSDNHKDRWLVAKKYFEENFEQEPTGNLDNNYQTFNRKPTTTLMKEYESGEDMTGVSISDADIKNGSPKPGDMIAQGKENPEDKWLVNKEYFEAKFNTTPKRTVEEKQNATPSASMSGGSEKGKKNVANAVREAKKDPKQDKSRKLGSP